MHWHWPSYRYSDPSSRSETERRLPEFLDELRLARSLGWNVVWTAHNLYPHDRTHHRIRRPFEVEDAERHHPDKRQRHQAEERDRRAPDAEPALAEDDRGIADIRAGQELAKADRLGEVGLRQPAALLHHRAVRPRHHAAERARADGEETEEQLA